MKSIVKYKKTLTIKILIKKTHIINIFVFNTINILNNIVNNLLIFELNLEYIIA